jgi:hypothetical protein
LGAPSTPLASKEDWLRAASSGYTVSNLRDEGDGIKTIATYFAKSESDQGVIAFATRDDFKRSWIFKSRDALMWWTLGDKGLLPAFVIECQLPRLAFGVQHFARNGLLEDSVAPRRISALVTLWGLSLGTPFGIWQPLRFDFAAVSINLWWPQLFCSLAASMWTVWLRMTGGR